MPEELTTTESLPDGATNVPPADGGVAGSDTAEEVVEVKDLLKNVLGKEFPTNEAAIKSLKDTYSYVGQMGQKVKTLEQELQEAAKPAVPDEVLQKVSSLEAQLKETQFYAAHPEFNDPAVKALIKDMGGNPDEVVQKDSFKTAFSALKTSADMEASKSVLHSNPRLGVVQDKLTQAKEAQAAGNDAAASAAAVASVLEAYESK